MAVEEFVRKCRELLAIERQTEVDETKQLLEACSPKELQRRGICLLKLRIGNKKTGLYGRTVISFETFWPGNDLPSHSLSAGDIVGVYQGSDDNSGDALSSGIVSHVNQASVNVAFETEQSQLDDDVQYRLVKLANDVTYRRLKQGLQKLEKYQSGPASHLINVLFGDVQPSITTEIPPHIIKKFGQDFKYLNSCLDDSQCKAVQFAIMQPDVAIIHGPPGTGKTTTVVEVILQMVALGHKVLACAPSNVAVDNLVEKLSQYNKVCKIVRLGHPARLLPHIHKHSLDAVLNSLESAGIVSEVRKDVDNASVKLKKAKQKMQQNILRQDLKVLRKELREREEAAIRQVLSRADVVLATLTTSDTPLKYLEEGHFEVSVIDECSQATEVACWLCLMHTRKCVLAGDHQQLPPTILSSKAARDGLGKTLMDRLLQLHGKSIMRMLKRQYRMNENIMKWSSEQMYGGLLVADESVEQHLLKDIDYVEITEDTSIPVLLIDTTGCNLWELEMDDELSKGNEGEADIATIHVQRLVNAGVRSHDIGVIAPYNMQVDLLRLRLSKKYPQIEIKSVDGFQGREKEAVIITLVRSNTAGEVGFLAEDRRINVAVTRARRHVAVICDCETVSHHKFLNGLVDYMTKHGEVRSAAQYSSELDCLETVARPIQLQQQVKQSKTKLPGQPHTQVKQSGAKPKTKASQKKGNVNSRLPHVSSVEKQVVTVTEQRTRAELVQLVEQFASQKDEQCYSFPASLGSEQRKLVHETAERLGLLHESKDEKENRYISIQKPPSKKSIPLIHKNQESENTPQLSLPSTKMAAEKSKTKAMSLQDGSENNKKICVSDADDSTEDCEVVELYKCPTCTKRIPSANIKLHNIRCSRQAQAALNQEKVKTAGKSKKHCFKDEEDLDVMIAAVVKADKSCGMSKCKNSIAVLGQVCKFCSERFCLSHHMPEVHGCGEKARAHARSQIRKDGELYRGSGTPCKKPDKDKRAALNKKMEKKLHELSSQRKPKQKNKEK